MRVRKNMRMAIFLYLKKSVKYHSARKRLLTGLFIHAVDHKLAFFHLGRTASYGEIFTGFKLGFEEQVNPAHIFKIGYCL